MAAHKPDRPEDSPEGGPVKSFLEHLEDFRWMLIKSIVALFLGMLVCLFAANYVVEIIKWPLKHAPIGFPGPNQIPVSALAPTISAISPLTLKSSNRSTPARTVSSPSPLSRS